MREIKYLSRVLAGGWEEAPDRSLRSRWQLCRPAGPSPAATKSHSSPAANHISFYCIFPLLPIDHVHHPAPQVARCCLRCPQLLSLVHLPRPRIGDDLRGGRRQQTFRLRLCHRTSCRTHGNQLESQQEDPTSRCTLFRTQPETLCCSLPILYVPKKKLS